MQLYRPIQTRFRFGSGLYRLNLATDSNSPVHSAKGTPSPCIYAMAPTACRHTVSGSISLPSRGAFHLSLTVLVHYRSPRVFSLGRWSPQLPTGFHVSRGTQDTSQSTLLFAYRAITLCGWPFQCRSAKTVLNLYAGPTTPSTASTSGLGSSRFARRYLGNLFDFFSSGYLDVSVPRVPSYTYVFSVRMTGHYPSWVAPFGNPRINACLRLPEAFRSLPRPSSALDAKASTVRP